MKEALISLWLSLAPAGEPCLKTCQVSQAGIAAIQHFEGYSPFVYKDSAGLDTIGYGHLIKPGEKFTEPMLPDTATELLRKDMNEAVRGVNRHVRVHLSTRKFDALVSFTYNTGTGAFKKSTLLKKVNLALHSEVPSQLMRWVRAGGREIRGLVIRREAEGMMYASD